jgi:hypothetical protein
MPLEYDPNTSEIRYEGNIVGRYDYRDGRAHVSLNLTYECAKEEWVVPVSWFDYGLSFLEKHKAEERIVLLTIQTDEADIAEEYQVRRSLTEVTVKRDGYIWIFHKTNTDQWPSAFHAHDYEKHLKLDAVTGNIYDAYTRQCCKTLSSKALEKVHDKLRESRDFTSRITELLKK